VAAWQTADVAVGEGVARVRMRDSSKMQALATGAVDPHWELADLFGELRRDNAVRVVILTGEGDCFRVAPGGAFLRTERGRTKHGEPTELWLTFAGLLRCLQTMVEMEKPIVAAVNGDAVGFGQSLVWASDLIVSREDARFMDQHMGFVAPPPGPEAAGAQNPVGGGRRFEPYPFSVVPGDGGAALEELYMAPPLAKEALMLSRVFTARQLADRGVINYAVPAAALEAKVDELVRGLLERGAYALAWTKRIANRPVVRQLNLAADAAAAYEAVNFLQLVKLGWENPTRLV
jgi:enoyl-CoA hydratase